MTTRRTSTISSYDNNKYPLKEQYDWANETLQGIRHHLKIKDAIGPPLEERPTAQQTVLTDCKQASSPNHQTEEGRTEIETHLMEDEDSEE